MTCENCEALEKKLAEAETLIDATLLPGCTCAKCRALKAYRAKYPKEK